MVSKQDRGFSAVRSAPAMRVKTRCAIALEGKAMKLFGWTAAVLLSASTALAEQPEPSHRLLISAHWIERTAGEFEGTLGLGELAAEFDSAPGLAIGLDFIVGRRWSVELKSGAAEADGYIRYRLSHDAEALVPLEDFRLYPVTAVLQFEIPWESVSTFVGVGGVYTFFESDLADFESDVGLVFAAGADYAFSSKWDVSADIKYVPFETASEIESPLGRSESFHVRPLIVSAGIAYRWR